MGAAQCCTVDRDDRVTASGCAEVLQDVDDRSLGSGTSSDSSGSGSPKEPETAVPTRRWAHLVSQESGQFDDEDNASTCDSWEHESDTSAQEDEQQFGVGSRPLWLIQVMEEAANEPGGAVVPEAAMRASMGYSRGVSSHRARESTVMGSRRHDQWSFKWADDQMTEAPPLADCKKISGKRLSKKNLKGQLANPDELMHALRSGAVLVDVRSDIERKTEFWLEGSLHLAWDRGESWMPTVGLPTKRCVPILVHCSNGHRANLAKDFLLMKGYLNVYNAGGPAKKEQWAAMVRKVGMCEEKQKKNKFNRCESAP